MSQNIVLNLMVQKQSKKGNQIKFSPHCVHIYSFVTGLSNLCQSVEMEKCVTVTEVCRIDRNATVSQLNSVLLLAGITFTNPTLMLKWLDYHQERFTL